MVLGKVNSFLTFDQNVLKSNSRRGLPLAEDKLVETSVSDEVRAKERLLLSPLRVLRTPSINFKELEKTYQEVMSGKDDSKCRF